ncbi:MAG: XRE family transcriptional regulator [Verrucomicrobia bacterium]|nr:XRE family transcriptional regulator [Verrucomicrobiota bacterium]
MGKKIKYERSSGNVFADLGRPNPEERLAKAEVARKLTHAIKKKCKTQKEAAELLGIGQSKVSALLNGNLRSFSLERLFRFLNTLGTSVFVNFREENEDHAADTFFGTASSGSCRSVPMVASGR